jgi:hypothetical protein
VVWGRINPGGAVERQEEVSEDLALEEEVRRLRAELAQERELRVAAEALAAERETAPADAGPALVSTARRRSRRLFSRGKLQGNWLPEARGRY